MQNECHRWLVQKNCLPVCGYWVILSTCLGQMVTRIRHVQSGDANVK
jgi:hypothetical protein